MFCMPSWGGTGCYWKHLGKGTLSSPGCQGKPPREKKIRDSSEEGRAGVCMRRGLSAQSAARAKRAECSIFREPLSSSTWLKSEAGDGGRTGLEVPVEGQRQERLDLKDSMLQAVIGCLSFSLNGLISTKSDVFRFLS